MTDDSVNVCDGYIRKLGIYRGSQEMLKRAITANPEVAEESVSKYFSGIVDACNTDSDLRDVLIAVNSDNTGIMKAAHDNYCQIRDGDRVEFDRPKAVEISIIAAGVDLDMQYGTEIAKEYFRGCKEAFKPQFRRFANEQYGEITGHNLISVVGEINVEKQTGKYSAPKQYRDEARTEPDLDKIMDKIIADSEAKSEAEKTRIAEQAKANAAYERKQLALRAVSFS
jgi:hypothetical protein